LFLVLLIICYMWSYGFLILCQVCFYMFSSFKYIVCSCIRFSDVINIYIYIYIFIVLSLFLMFLLFLIVCYFIIIIYMLYYFLIILKLYLSVL